MAQEFTINSTAIEDKINQLLPSQGGSGAGIDFSASTMVVPIIDLTESASGSSLRQDLQTAFSHTSTTSFDVSNTTSTLISTTGYYRVFGAISLIGSADTIKTNIFLTDGTTDKILLSGNMGYFYTFVGSAGSLPFDFNVFIAAGEELKATSPATTLVVRGATRQIADISGNLINP